MPFANANPNEELPGVTPERSALLLQPLPGEHRWYPATGANGPPQLVIRSVSATGFQLVRPFRYRRPESTTWHTIFHDPFSDPASPHNSTNFASVPTVVWSLIAPYGRQTRAAIIHDQFFENPNAADAIDVDEANLLFRDALMESDVPFVRRWIMWTAVDAWGRTRGWAGRISVTVQVLTALAFLAALVYLLLDNRGWFPDGWWPSNDPQPLWVFRSDPPFLDGQWTIPWGAPALAMIGIAAGRKGWPFTVLACITLLIPAVTAFVFGTLQWILELICLVPALVAWAFKGRFTGHPRPTRPPWKPTHAHLL